jgi:AraC-like DNA-binding protein
MPPRPDLVSAHYGRERFAGLAALARHRHETGYVAVVLDGGYLEAGDRGRRRVTAGDVLVHEAFETHLNAMGRAGADVLNLPLPDRSALPPAGRAADPDLLARLAERSLAEASEALAEGLTAGPVPLDDWPDLLAAACLAEGRLAIGEWARHHGLAAATVSRGFAKAYGVSPARYRVEARSRRAWQAIVGTSEPLAAIAAEAGFADQSHMTRCVASLTGRPAGGWRAPGQIRSRSRTAPTLA